MKCAVVTEPVSTIYEGPFTEKKSKGRSVSAISDEGLAGMLLEVTGEETKGYLPVRTFYGYTGYIPAEGVRLLSSEEGYAWEASDLWVTDAFCVDVVALPVVEGVGCKLWDVEYVKEAGQWFLRIYIDKEGGVSIDDCEAVSRPLSDLLDEADPIEGSYTFEVSSAGADRALKKPEHFAAFLGEEVEVKLYRPREGRKEFVGVLKGYEIGDVTLDVNGAETRFSKQEIALVRLYPRF